jgi:hypothetical protein
MSDAVVVLAAPAQRRHAALGRRANLAIATLVVAHTLWTSAAPAIACRLYAREWNLSHTITTVSLRCEPPCLRDVLV